MRPPKTILLCGTNDEVLSPLRFVLRNSTHRERRRCYQVTTVLSAQDALESLRTNKYDILIVQCPLEHLQALMRRTRIIDGQIKIMILAESNGDLPYVFADAVMFGDSMTLILKKLTELAKRKVGPHTGWQKNVTEETFMLDEAVA